MLKCGGHIYVFKYINGSYEGEGIVPIYAADGERNTGFKL